MQSLANISLKVNIRLKVNQFFIFKFLKLSYYYRLLEDNIDEHVEKSEPIVQEERHTPLKFTVPHAKGMNSLNFMLLFYTYHLYLLIMIDI